MNKGDNDRIDVRLYAASADVSEANAVRRAIESIVANFASIVRSDEPSKYWKMPELFEVFIVCKPLGRTADAFDQLLGELGSGWTEHRFATGDNWAVWNPGTDSRFALSAVRWAHVECVREPDGNP